MCLNQRFFSSISGFLSGLMDSRLHGPPTPLQIPTPGAGPARPSPVTPGAPGSPFPPAGPSLTSPSGLPGHPHAAHLSSLAAAAAAAGNPWGQPQLPPGKGKKSFYPDFSPSLWAANEMKIYELPSISPCKAHAPPTIPAFIDATKQRSIMLNNGPSHVSLCWQFPLSP